MFLFDDEWLLWGKFDCGFVGASKSLFNLQHSTCMPLACDDAFVCLCVTCMLLSLDA